MSHLGRIMSSCDARVKLIVLLLMYASRAVIVATQDEYSEHDMTWTSSHFRISMIVIVQDFGIDRRSLSSTRLLSSSALFR
jgi:hypothetical protein